jgi:uncharacterized integral membrane protein (TIGR00698 family)
MAENNGEIVVDEKRSGWAELIRGEDYWSIWLGIILFLIAVVFIVPNPPKDMQANFDKANATMQKESERAPFRTIAFIKAEDAKGKMKGRSAEPLKTLYSYTAKPGKWKSNPISSFYLNEEDAKAVREANKEKYVKAKAKTAAALAAAMAAEAAAAAAQFKSEELNDKAKDLIAQWRGTKRSEGKVKKKANQKPFNYIGSMIILMIALGLFFAIGVPFMGMNAKNFLIGFPVLFIIAVLAYILAGQAQLKALGISYVLFALVIGLVIANTVGTPSWVKPALLTEYFIKTGLVLLGARILISKIALIGIPGLGVTWVVTPIVLITTYWFGQQIVKMPSKELNITISADMSVSGVSAAIATAAACKAKKEELTLAIGLSMVFVAIMIFVLPAIANGVGMPQVLAGAWLGGTVDNTGSVVAAGELIGPVAMYTAATIKMIQNILIGVTAFCVAAYWSLVVERDRNGAGSQMDLTFGSAMAEIWRRFPKFILGFIGASIVFSILYSSMGHDWGKVMIDNGILAWANKFRGWFFCLAFVSIGLSTDFRELAVHFKGGKPVILYVFGQTFNLFLTLFVAWLMFYVIFPDITARILE